MEYQSNIVARPLAEWHEDDGDALWWRFPITEPPWVGTPLDDAWIGDADDADKCYYTHWTPIPMPCHPDNAPAQVDVEATIAMRAPRPRNNMALQSMLLLVEDWEIPEADIAAISDEEYRQVHAWASASILRANDHDDITIPPRPSFIDTYEARLNPPGTIRDYSASAASAGRFVAADRAGADAGGGQTPGGPAASAGAAGVSPSYDGPGG